MAQALEKVKKDLGRNAVILHTRTLTKGGMLGVGGKTVVEITASRDVNALPVAERRALAGSQRGRKTPIQSQNRTKAVSPRSFSARQAYQSQAKDAFAESSDSADKHGLSTLHNQVDELRSMVRELLNRPAASSASIPEVPDELRRYYTRLIQNAVAEEMACKIIAKAKDRLIECRVKLKNSDYAGMDSEVQEKQLMKELTRAVLIESIEKMLPGTEPVQSGADNQSRYVALVGPTGVGKTTTIAKLAARFKLRESKNVGLITIDTYRIAAVDQLKTYADILDVPLEIVYTPEEMKIALERMADRDLILIDTSGRSQNDTPRLQELKAFLDVARDSASTFECCISDNETTPDNADTVVNRASVKGLLETHLVLSCTAHPQQLVSVAEKFAMLGIDRVVFTKLDEAVGLGVILDTIDRLNLQLSYLTTGQDVPDDIEVGHCRRIAEMILNEKEDSANSEPGSGADKSSLTSVDQVA